MSGPHDSQRGVAAVPALLAYLLVGPPLALIAATPWQLDDVALMAQLLVPALDGHPVLRALDGAFALGPLVAIAVVAFVEALAGALAVAPSVPGAAALT